MDVYALVRQGAALKEQIEKMTSELRIINKQLEGITDFDEGSKTGHIYVKDYKVTVTIRENEKWDQTKLLELKKHFPHFNDWFKSEFKPINKKLKIAMLQNEELANAIKWARTIAPGAPSVKYEFSEKETF